MWLNISGQGPTVDAAVREHVERRLGFALSQFGDRIGRVTVHLTDANEPWGGEDKRCRVVVEVLGHARVVVEDTDRDLNVAIDRAADRVGQAVFLAKWFVCCRTGSIGRPTESGRPSAASSTEPGCTPTSQIRNP